VPDRRAPDGVVDVAIERGELRLQRGQRGIQRVLDTRIAGLLQPVGLHADHLHHLATTADEIREAAAVGVGQRARFGADALGEQRDDLGVERVGLGQPPDGAGERADLPGIDHGQRQTGTGERCGDDQLEAAGGLQHDQRRRQTAQCVDQLVEPLAVARHRE